MATAVATPTQTAASDTSDLGTVARLGAQKSKFKAAAKRLTEERDAERAKVAELQKQIDDLKKVGPEEIANLKAQIAEVKHRAKFDDVAKAAGVHEKGLQDLWEKSGYKPEGDAPDEAKIKAAIETQKTERPFLFTLNGQQQTTEQPQLLPGPGRGQGGTAPNNTGPFGISQQQLRDPNWCMQNQAAIAKAAKAASTLPVSQVASQLAILS